ncbi:MAG: N-acetylmuramoyl-L-alanine amidase [Patescibacteria group bacterium]|nr:N-acetylmuramoyl-L-alanine amidase [Patescibacteria group bacterium]MCL5262017.1 N-acetylmuramoyl-L-alanine amidase [Patescibacteria group bacterium]
MIAPKSYNKKVKLKISTKIFCAILIAAAAFLVDPKFITPGADKHAPADIVRRLLAWGNLASEKPREIDTIVIHTSYNAWGKDPFDVDGIIKQYKHYDVAPHFLIDRQGRIHELAPVENVADHAGKAQMPDGRANVNDFSIGIELVNKPDTFMTIVQYEALAGLIKDLGQKHPIDNVVGHSAITTIDKTDPWNFEWERLNYLLYFDGLR